MAESVVDLLEAGRPVQVDQQETGPGPGDARAGERLSAALGQQLAVEQAGQLVVICLVVTLHRPGCADVDGREREREQRDDQP